MSADKTRILTDIAELVRSISDAVLPGEEIGRQTRLVEDLEMQSLHLVNLGGRIQTRYGAECNLVPFFAGREAGPFAGLQVGELVDYVASILDAPAVARDPAMTVQAEERAEDLLAELARDLDQPYDPGQNAGANANAEVLAELAPGVERRMVSLADGQVEVFGAGEGQPLILMHPINVGAGVFARQFADLAGQYRVICMHAPGVGATTWGGELSLAGIARMFRATLAQMSVEPAFHVLGSSFGGLVAQQFALLYPQDCSSLVLVGCSYRTGARPGVRTLSAVAQGEFDGMHEASADHTMAGDRTELEQLLLRCESMDARAGMKYLDAFAARPSLLRQLPDIAAPTLILRGRHDTMVPAKHAHLLYGAIPEATLEELPGAGHFPCLTHPAEVGQLVVPFLAAHQKAPAPVDKAGPAGRGGRGGRGGRAGQSRLQAAAERSRADAPLTVPAPPDPCTIIISSGRCGSTLLSALVAEEPGTLSASESLAMIRPHLTLMPLTKLTGAQYWSLLSEPSELGSLMTRLGVVPSEYRYPDHGRFAADQSTIPPILYVTLPGVSADPDLLFSILAEKVPQFPAQSVGLHHKMLLNLMTGLTGKRRWIERSGASSALALPLLEAFPEAKIVYLTRNIPETALSMSRHASFQFAAVRHEFHLRYGTDPYARWMRSDMMPAPEDMPEEVRRLLPDQLTAQTLRDMGQDLPRYEAMCAHMMGSAEQALADMKPAHLHRIQYEDLVSSPQEELSRLGEFLGFPDAGGWAAATAAQVRPSRVASVPSA